MSTTGATIRFALCSHVQGYPFDQPRWAEPPRLRAKQDPMPGKGTTVAVLDSGISRHPWLSNSYQDEDLTTHVEQWDLRGEALPRHVGHGTFVAGVVLQYSPQSWILPRRVIDLFGESEDDLLAAAIDRLQEADPDVLNLSLGAAPAPHPGHHDEGESQTRAAIKRLQEACGTVVVVAAGNDREPWPQRHIALDDPLTAVVGALDQGAQPAWFSAREGVRLWAPGVDVVSSFVHWAGMTAGEPAEDGDGGASPPSRPVAPFIGWARWNGTSFAAPAVAGAIAAEISRVDPRGDKRERRLEALRRVTDAAHDADFDGVKARILAAAPVALQGPPLPACHQG